MADVSLPTEDLIRYLLCNYSDRFAIPPKKFEEIVAAVYSAAGYSVRATSYSRDRGIDVFVLDGQGNELVGVQVKRYRGKIKPYLIRELAGAMQLNQVSKGVLITTSKFTRGAEATASDYRNLKCEIELCDAASFYDRLGLVRREMYVDGDDETAPFFRVFERLGEDVPIAFETSKSWDYGGDD